MKRPSHILLAILLGWVFLPTCAHAQDVLARRAVTELIEGYAESWAKQFDKDLVEIGGENTLREVIEKAAAEGGDDLVRQVVALGKSSGPRAIKALEGDPALMTKAIRGLPDGTVADAVIEASRQPALMAKLVRAHGKDVLTAAARHPGIGTQVIEEFGVAGLKATRNLSTEEVILLAKVKGFSELPKASQGKFIFLLDRDPRAVTNALKQVAGGTAIVLSADFIKEIEKVIFPEDGKAWLLINPPVTYSWVIGGVLVAVLAAYASTKLWGEGWRRYHKTRELDKHLNLCLQ